MRCSPFPVVRHSPTFPYHTPWSPILAHTNLKVSVYFTGFRNTRFRSVTLRKSIGWNLAPEEKITLFPPAENVHLWFQKYIFSHEKESCPIKLATTNKKSYIFVIWTKKDLKLCIFSLPNTKFSCKGALPLCNPRQGASPLDPCERLAQALGLFAINWVPHVQNLHKPRRNVQFCNL